MIQTHSAPRAVGLERHAEACETTRDGITMNPPTPSKAISKRPPTHLVLLVTLGAVFLARGFVDAQPREKIRVALGTVTVNSSPIPIGREAGIFAKHGLEVEAIHMGGG